MVAASLEILGGQGVQAYSLMERLRAEGHEVQFLPINPAFPAGFKRLKHLPYLRTVLNQVLYLPSLWRLRHADVVHVFSASYWSFLLAPAPAMFAAKRLGKRVVLNYHSGEAEDHLQNWGKLVHPWLRLADEIVVPSPYLKGVFAHHGYRARVIHNVVDTARFNYRERAPLRPALLSVRNFEPHYRVANTISAYALLKRRYPDATLTLAGYGSEEERLRRLAAPLGDGVRFLGKVSPASVQEVYDAADVFVNSSVVDNQPVSVLEACASGLPVVSTPTGDIAAMLRQGEAGVLVPASDPAAMADAIAGLLEDPARVLAITRRARAEVERYTWPEIRRQWIEVYHGEDA
jgi:glycosyltransferase involved in cell wall biosynthesis